MVFAAAAALFLPGTAPAQAPPPDGPPSAVWTLSADQAEVVREHGHPDSFTLVCVDGGAEDPGHRHRMEAWYYHGAQVAVVFVDGEERGIRKLGWPAAHPRRTTRFRPGDFALGMTVHDVEILVFPPGSGRSLGIPEGSPEYQPVTHGGLELGFERGELVYVDTSPDPSGGG